MPNQSSLLFYFFVIVTFTVTFAPPSPPPSPPSSELSPSSSPEPLSKPSDSAESSSTTTTLSPLPSSSPSSSFLPNVLSLTAAGKAEAAKVKTLDVVGRVREKADAAQKEAKKEEVTTMKALPLSTPTSNVEVANKTENAESTKTPEKVRPALKLTQNEAQANESASAKQQEKEKLLTSFIEELELHINSAISSLQAAKRKASELRQSLLSKTPKSNDTQAFSQSSTSQSRKILDALDLALVSSGLVHGSEQFDNSAGEHNQNDDSATTADADKE